MTKFEQYLISIGIHFETAGRYANEAEHFAKWLKDNKLKAHNLKRSQFTDWLQLCRKRGNSKRTLIAKENVIKHYFFFLGVKNNPAINWVGNRKEHKLPPTPIEKKELAGIYEKEKPRSPAGYRNRCMLGLVVFQGLMRSELTELRVSDFKFESGEVFVQGQLRTNPRTLKLEPAQALHLYDYLQKYRKEFLTYKENKGTDKFFLSAGKGLYLDNAVTGILNRLKREFPQIKDLHHVRGSVITHWQKNEGIMEAMEKAGHRYITSTQRYQTNNYEELQDQLKSLHPLEHLNVSGNQ